MFAHFAQETGNHNPSDKEYEEWRQVVNNVENIDYVGNDDNVENIGSID